MLWLDLTYQPEAEHPFGMKRPADVVAYNPEIYGWYRKLIQLRLTHTALATGDIHFHSVPDMQEVLFFSRSYEGQELYILVNSQSSDVNGKVTLPIISAESMTDLITHKQYMIFGKNIFVSLLPYQIAILARD